MLSDSRRPLDNKRKVCCLVQRHRYRLNVLGLFCCLISTLCLASEAFQITPGTLPGGRHGSIRSSCGVRGFAANAEPISTNGLSRRALGGLLAGFVIQAATAAHSNAVSANEVLVWKDDASKGFEGYTAAEKGLRYKDLKAGVGSPVKAGDVVRFRYAAYLLDGTLASTYVGVEQSQVTLGAKEIPAGLDLGLTGMQVGGERIMVIPPEIGWSADYRAAAGLSLRPCDPTKCPLETQPVVVVLSLEGYHKAQCVGAPDVPISADLSQLKQAGRITFTIGSETCPDGDPEITERVERAKALIQRLRGEGKIQMEGNRPKTWVDQ